MWLSSLEGRQGSLFTLGLPNADKRKAACCCIRLAKRKRKVNDRTTSRWRRGTREDRREEGSRVDRRRRKDHSRGRRRNGGGEKALLSSDGMAGMGCLFVSRGRVRWHSSLAFPPSSSFLFCARLEVFLAYLIVSPSISPRGFHLPPFLSLPSPNGRQTVSC